MSTLKVSEIKSPSTTAGGLSIDSSGAVSGGLPAPHRNLLYNGAMQVAQRGTSATGITASAYNTADRWRLIASSLGTWTETVEADAPAGFASSLKALCTTANASPSASAQLRYEQVLEGQDLQRIAKGTASAQQLTISFWVKSNVTGTYIVWLYDSDNSRHVSGSYTVSASATWEQKSITFPADSTGAFTNDSNGSLIVSFGLAVGSDWSSGTLSTSWASMVNANRFVGQTNLASAVNNYWQITGVQLEVGDTATEFEHKPYGVELAECQRYYCVINAANKAVGFGYVDATSVLRAFVPTPTSMRATPVIENGVGFNQVGTNNGSLPTGTASVNGSNSSGIFINVSGISATAYNTGVIVDGGNFDAEL